MTGGEREALIESLLLDAPELDTRKNWVDVSGGAMMPV